MKYKKLFSFALVLVLIFAFGCRRTPESDDSPPAPFPSDENPPIIQEADNPLPDEESEPPQKELTKEEKEKQQIEALLKAERERGDIEAQRKRAEAEAAFKLGLQYYNLRRYEQAEVEFGKALQLNPDHLSAKIHLSEIKILLGKANDKNYSDKIGEYLNQTDAEKQRVIKEIEVAFRRGRDAFNIGRYVQAERDFRFVLESIKYITGSIDLDQIKRDATQMLEVTKKKRSEKELYEKVMERKFIERENLQKEMSKKIEDKRRLQLMYEAAQAAFEQQDYEQAIKMCERILFINPNITAARDMMTVARKLRHSRNHEYNLHTYVAEWKNVFETIDLKSIVPDDYSLLKFPPRDVWEGELAARKPKSIRADEEQRISPEDIEVNKKLDSIRIKVELNDSPLSSAIDILRQKTGINFHIKDPGIASTLITLTLTNMKARDILSNLLNATGDENGFYVEDGIVYIDLKENINKRVKWDMYDIHDLILGITQFPGEDIILTSAFDGGASRRGPQSPGDGDPPDVDQLVDLIKNALGGEDAWDDPNGIEVNNGILIVTHTPEMHERLKKFLVQLREQSTIMVGVEARFMMVEKSLLEDIGIDFRDLDSASIPEAATLASRRVSGITSLDDLQVPFADNPFNGATAGIASTFGTHIPRPVGARVESILSQDLNANKFYSTILSPTGGTQLQYTLLDDISLEAILRMTKKKRRSTVLAAPSITLFNGQRGNILVVDQLAYVKDYSPQIAGAGVINDPIIDVVSQGVSLDVKPIVSADKRFVTMELRPTSARLDPPPPNIAQIAAGGGIIELPNLLIQRIRTTVIVPDRGTLMVGGLINYFEVNETAGLPLWKNIPILGMLGSTKLRGKSILQHMVLLRTRIIIPTEVENRTFK